jgi:ribosome assembly protein 1
MKEGTSFFTVKALLPVVESFGFADGTSLGEFSTLN